MKKSPVGFLVVFALFWTAMVFLFDTIILRDLVQQSLTYRYAMTEGTILSSKVVQESDSDGPTYRAAILYEYQVEGRRFESARVRVGQDIASDRKKAKAAVRDNPPGARRPVYYDPAEPSASVLQRGPDGQNWFLLMFITPFNAAAVLLWSLALAALRASPPRGGALVTAEGSRLLVCVNPWHPAGTHLAIWAVLSFVSVFLIGFTFGFAPPAAPVWGVWLVSAICSMFVAARRSPTKPDLVIDAAAGRLELSPSRRNGLNSPSEWRAWRADGKPAIFIPFEHLRAVSAVERGDDESVSHVVCLSVADSPGNHVREHDLGLWSTAHRAESFAAWLRETLQISTTVHTS